MDPRLKNWFLPFLLLVNLGVAYCTVKNNIYVIKAAKNSKLDSGVDASRGADVSDSSYAASQTVEDAAASDTIVYNRFAEKLNDKDEDSASEESDGPPDHTIPYSEHEESREVPTRPKYTAPGEWAKPPPEKDIPLDFVPSKVYAQVRGTHTLKRLPQEEAVNNAETSEEAENAARLRQVVKNTKINTVYTEEGYEDSAYDHAGQIRDADFHEGYAKKLHDQKADKKGSRKQKQRKGKLPFKKVNPEDFKDYDDDYSDHFSESASIDSARKPVKYKNGEYESKKNHFDLGRENDIDPKRVAEKGLRALEEDLSREAEEIEKDADSADLEHRSESKASDDSISDSRVEYNYKDTNEQPAVIKAKKRRKSKPRVKIPTRNHNWDSAGKKSKSSQTSQESGKYSEENLETTTITFNRQAAQDEPSFASLTGSKSTSREVRPNQLSLSSADHGQTALTTTNPLLQLSPTEDNTDYGQIFWDYFKSNKIASTIQPVLLQETTTLNNEEKRTPVALATINNRGPYLLVSNEEATTLPPAFFELQTYYPETSNLDYNPNVNGPISQSIVGTQSTWTTPINSNSYTESPVTTVITTDVEDDPRAHINLNAKSNFMANPFLSPLVRNSYANLIKAKYKVILRNPPNPTYYAGPKSQGKYPEKVNPKYIKMLEYIRNQQKNRHPEDSSSKEQIVDSSGSSESTLENFTIMRPPLLRQSGEVMYSDFLPHHSRGKLANADRPSVSDESESSSRENWKKSPEQLDQPHNAVAEALIQVDPPAFQPLPLSLVPPSMYQMNPPPLQVIPPPKYHAKKNEYYAPKYRPIKYRLQAKKYRPLIVKINESVRIDRRRRFVGNESNEHSQGGKLKGNRGIPNVSLKISHIVHSRTKRDSRKSHEELLDESPKISESVIDKEIDARFNQNEESEEDDDETGDDRSVEVEAEVPDFDYVEELVEDNEIEIPARTEATIDYGKYPYYNNSKLPSLSVLKYIVDPRKIPRKTKGRMAFYESRDAYKRCEDVDPDLETVLPEKEEPDPDRDVSGSQPRLKGLGDKLDCFKAKYFDENPLDNPLFLEKRIDEPKIPLELYAEGFSRRILRLPEEKDKYVIQRMSKQPEITKPRRRSYSKSSERNSKPIKLIILKPPPNRRPRKENRRPNRGAVDKSKYRRARTHGVHVHQNATTPTPVVYYATPYERQVYEDVMGHIVNLASDQQVYETATVAPVTQQPQVTEANTDVEQTGVITKFERDKDTGFPIVDITENPANAETLTIQKLSPPPYPPAKRLKKRPYYRHQHSYNKSNKLRRPTQSRFVRHHRPIHLRKRSTNSSLQRNVIPVHDFSGERNRHFIAKRSLSGKERMVQQSNPEIEKIDAVAEIDDLVAEETKQTLTPIVPLDSSVFKKSERPNDKSKLLENATTYIQLPAHTTQKIIYTINDRIRHSRPKDNLEKVGEFTSEEVASTTTRRNEPRYNQIRRRKVPVKEAVGLNVTNISNGTSFASPETSVGLGQLHENQRAPIIVKPGNTERLEEYLKVKGEVAKTADVKSEVEPRKGNEESPLINKESVSATTEKPYEPVTSAEYARLTAYLATNPEGYAEAFPEESKKLPSDDKSTEDDEKSRESQKSETEEDGRSSSETLEKEEEFFKHSERPSSPPESYDDPRYADLGPRVNKPAFYHPPFSFLRYDRPRGKYFHDDSGVEDDSDGEKDEFAESKYHGYSLGHYEYPWEKRRRLERERRRKRKESKYDTFEDDEDSDSDDDNDDDDDKSSSSNKYGRYVYPWEKYDVPSKRHTKKNIFPKNRRYYDNDEGGSDNHPITKYSSKYRISESKNESNEDSSLISEEGRKDSVESNPTVVGNQKEPINKIKSIQILVPTEIPIKNETNPPDIKTNPVRRIKKKKLSVRPTTQRKASGNSSENFKPRLIPVRRVDDIQSSTQATVFDIGRRAQNARNNSSYASTEKTLINSTTERKKNIRRRIRPITRTTTSSPLSTTFRSRRRKVNDPADKTKETIKDFKLSSTLPLSDIREKGNSTPSSRIVKHHSKISKEHIITKTVYPRDESAFDVQKNDHPKNHSNKTVIAVSPAEINIPSVSPNTKKSKELEETKTGSKALSSFNGAIQDEESKSFTLPESFALAAQLRSLSGPKASERYVAKQNKQEQRKVKEEEKEEEEEEEDSSEETSKERKRIEELRAKIKDPGHRLYYYIDDRRK